MMALDMLPKYRAISFRGWPFFVPAGFFKPRERGSNMAIKDPTPVERIASNIVGRMTCEPLGAICQAAQEVICVASAHGIELSGRDAFERVTREMKLIAFAERPAPRPRLTIIQGGAS